MRLIALETTEIIGSVAALEEGHVLAEIGLTPHQRCAQSVAPALKDLLTQLGWSPRQVGLFAVSIGPGSFTGLRVGVTTAKTLSYALGADVVGVNTLEAIAAQAPSDVDSLWAVIDAQRSQVFAMRFQRKETGILEACHSVQILDIDHWLESLRSGDCVTGPVLEKMLPRIPSDVRILPPEYWRATARAVGQLGWKQYQAGTCDDVWTLSPLYIRKSAAEEKFGRRPKTED